MTYETELARLHRARMGLVMASPFFTTLVLRLTPKVDDTLKAAFWTDGTIVGVHPAVAADLPMDELEGVFARATLHAAFGHPLRRENRDPQRWNEAAAHVADLEVLGAGMKLPPGSPADPQYKGMTVEQVYALLAPPPDDNSSGSGQRQGQGEAGKQGKPAAGTGTSQPATTEPGSGEVRDAPGDEAAIEEQAGEWQQAVAQAAQLARAAGQLPGDLERAAQKVVDARVAWQEALQRYFKSKARDDYSWLKPNRRFMSAAGIYMPGLDSVRMGPLVFAVDMSASVTQKAIDQFFAEVETARLECHPEFVVVLPFDSAVRASFKFESDDVIEIKAKAGGGTDFRPVVEWLRENDIQPDALVYLTDLECNSFADEPEYPVLWVTVRDGKAPYGEIIRLQ